MDKIKEILTYTEFDLRNKINELVEAVNELEQVKAKVEELERDVICLGKGK